MARLMGDDERYKEQDAGVSRVGRRHDVAEDLPRQSLYLSSTVRRAIAFAEVQDGPSNPNKS